MGRDEPSASEQLTHKHTHAMVCIFFFFFQVSYLIDYAETLFVIMPTNYICLMTFL